MRFLLAVVFLVGCGAEAEEPVVAPVDAQPVMCGARDDLYKLHFVQTSGTCATPDDYVQRADSKPPVAKNGCSETWGLDETLCVEMEEQTCMDESGTRVFRSKVTWTTTGDRARGTLFVQMSNPAGDHCTGVYDVLITRL